MKTGGRLIENEQGRVGTLLTQVIGQLYTLVLTTRECAARLPQFDIAQSYIL